MSADDRRLDIVCAAACLFAEHGFAATTRELAARLGVTQALLYKHFASKDDLVEAVFEHVYARRWTKDFDDIIGDRSRPLAERLLDVYAGYPAQDDGLSLRLFLRAALDGYPIARRRGEALTGQILAPLVRELRHEEGLPALGRVALRTEERELAMMLHAAVVFLGIRTHVYRVARSEDRPVAVRLYVETFLAGARATIRRVHTAGSESAAAVIAPARPANS